MGKTVVDIIACTLARLLESLLLALPYAYALRVARGCIRLLLLCIPRARPVGLRNLALVFPEKSEAERRLILERSFDVLADHLLSFARYTTLSRTAIVASLENHAQLMADFAAFRTKHGEATGVLVPTMHFGPFEITAHFCALCCGKGGLLTRSFGLPRLDRWCNAHRQLHGHTVFDRKGGYSEIIRRLRNRQHVAILADQNVKLNHAMFVDFFGIKTATTRAVGLVAVRTNCPIFFIVSVPMQPGQYRALYKEIEPSGAFHGSARQKAVWITEQIHAAMEEVIRQRPEAWFWLHRRFKTRPPGEPENLYEDL